MTSAEPGATSPRLQLPANSATYRPLRSSSALAALTNLTTPSSSISGPNSTALACSVALKTGLWWGDHSVTSNRNPLENNGRRVISKPPRQNDPFRDQGGCCFPGSAATVHGAPA